MNALHLRMAALVLGATALTGCVSYTPLPAFDYRFHDNDATKTGAVAGALHTPLTVGAASKVPFAVATTDTKPRTLVAVDLATGKSLWTSPLASLVRPDILGDVVLVSVRDGESEQVTAVDATTGNTLWRKGIGKRAYVGADRTGNTIIFVTSVGAGGGEKRAGSVYAVDARSGSQRWKRDSVGILGTPAAAGDFVFVPWERQNIAILDAKTGIEQTRLRTTDDVIAWVAARPAGVFYGAGDVYRFNDRSSSGTREGSLHAESPIPDPPGEPLLADDAFVPKPGNRSARGRIRVYFEPAENAAGTAIPVVSDTFYFVYYRYVFAFESKGDLRWVRMVPKPIASAQVLPSGLYTVSDDGTATLLAAATGNDAASVSVNVPVASIAMDASALSLPNGGKDAPRDLRKSLNEVAIDADNTLVMGRAFAIRLLAKLPEPEVTRDLLDLYAQRSMPATLRDAIKKALKTRTTGLSNVIGSLDERYDFLDDRVGPPLDLVVPSLVANQQKAAVPGLIKHMLDHETPAATLPLVVSGIVALGDASVVPTLMDFLRLYRADSTFAKRPDALLAAASGVFKFGGPDGRAALTALADGTGTLAPVTTAIRAMFAGEEGEKAALAKADKDAASKAAKDAAQRAAAALPPRLTQAQINATFATKADAIRTCILEELARSPQLGKVRWTFVVERNGRGHNFTYAPNSREFVGCVAPAVETLAFPKFKQARQAGVFSITMRAAGDGSDVTAADPEDGEGAAPGEQSKAPWWVRDRSRYASVGEDGIGAATTPWWIQRKLAGKKAAGTEATNVPDGADGSEVDDDDVNNTWWIPTEE